MNWPVGIGGKGNDGVAALTRQTNGAIGYVEYAYAKQNHMSYCPDAEQGRPLGRADGRELRGRRSGRQVGRRARLLPAAGRPARGEAWPISGATFILMHKKQTNAQAAHDVLAFYDWAYKNGDPAAISLDYVPLPDSVKGLIRNSWRTIVGPNGKPVYP